MRCNAFNKKDHRRCRLQVCPGMVTCKIHRNYYSDWLETHTGFHPLIVSKREIEEYTYQIKNRLVVIPDSYISELEVYYAEYYYFLIHHTGCHAHLNIECLTNIIKRYSYILFNTNNDVEIILEIMDRIIPLFTDPKSIARIFNILWTEFVWNCVSRSTLVGDAVQQFHHIFLHPCWKPLLYIGSFLEFHKAMWKNQILEFVENEWMQLDRIWTFEIFKRMLEEFKDYLKRITVTRMNITRREILEASLTPRRIKYLLEQGYTLDEIFQE